MNEGPPDHSGTADARNYAAHRRPAGAPIHVLPALCAFSGWVPLAVVGFDHMYLDWIKFGARSLRIGHLRKKHGPFGNHFGSSRSSSFSSASVHEAASCRTTLAVRVGSILGNELPREMHIFLLEGTAIATRRGIVLGVACNIFASDRLIPMFSPESVLWGAFALCDVQTSAPCWHPKQQCYNAWH